MKHAPILLVVLALLVGCNSSGKDMSMSLDDSGTLTVDGYVCEIAPDESYLVANLHGDAIHWELRVHAKDSDDFYKEYDEDDEDDEYDEDDNIPFASPSLFVFFRTEILKDWREISGFSTKIVYEDEFTLLPDNPSGAYLGYHLIANNHSIRFGGNQGNLFKVVWTCDARESWEQKGCSKFSIDGIVQFRSVDIASEEIFHFATKNQAASPRKGVPQKMPKDWGPNVVDAKALLAGHFNLKDFGEPEVQHWGVRFPVKDVSKQ